MAGVLQESQGYGTACMKRYYLDWGMHMRNIRCGTVPLSFSHSGTAVGDPLRSVSLEESFVPVVLIPIQYMCKC